MNLCFKSYGIGKLQRIITMRKLHTYYKGQSELWEHQILRRIRSNYSTLICCSCEQPSHFTGHLGFCYKTKHTIIQTYYYLRKCKTQLYIKTCMQVFVATLVIILEFGINEVALQQINACAILYTVFNRKSIHFNNFKQK